MRRAPATLSLLALLLLARPARPQTQEVPRPADLVKHGLELRRERHDAEALAEFREAYSLEPAPRTLAQIALAEQALGRWVEAEADLRTALAASDDAWIAAHRSALTAGLATIKAHLGEIVVEADVDGAELLVNGAHAGVLPLAGPLRIEAGTAVVEVRAAGYATARRMTSVEPGGSAREVVHLVPLSVTAPPSAPPAPSADRLAPTPPLPPPARTLAPREAPGSPAHRTLRAASIVVLSAAALGLAAGTYFGVRTLTIKSDRDGHCLGQACDAMGVALDEQARSFATRSTAWFAAGLAAGGVGVTLLVISLPHGPARAPVAGARFDFGPDRVGASVGASW
jgi:hypothetical protein